jgi:hypothetical protein
MELHNLWREVAMSSEHIEIKLFLLLTGSVQSREAQVDALRTIDGLTAFRLMPHRPRTEQLHDSSRDTSRAIPNYSLLRKQITSALSLAKRLSIAGPAID